MKICIEKLDVQRKAKTTDFHAGTLFVIPVSKGKLQKVKFKRVEHGTLFFESSTGDIITKQPFQISQIYLL